MKSHGAKSGLRWTFHPFEMGFVGYKNSGKTTLIERLVPILDLDVAYVKHDAHGFEFDHVGKDTQRLTVAGARTVFIGDSTSKALLSQVPLDPVFRGLDFLEEDAALVEGYKQSEMPRIVVLDEAFGILDDPAFLGRPPLAVVGPGISAPPLPWNVPYFCRNEIGAIAAFVLTFWRSLVQNRPLCGLVLTGGKSSRMGRDKASLQYHGEEQSVFAFRLLESVCDEVFISCRADQADQPGRRGLPQVHDRLLDYGPLSGILAALEFRPDAAWFVVACDLPRLDAAVLTRLLKERNPFRFATAYRGYENLPEPLCAIYEPKSRSRLFQFLAAGHDCPRKMLINSPVNLVEPEEAAALDNVNDESSYFEVLHDLGI